MNMPDSSKKGTEGLFFNPSVPFLLFGHHEKVGQDKNNHAKNGPRVTEAGTYDQVACFTRSGSRAEQGGDNDKTKSDTSVP